MNSSHDEDVEAIVPPNENNNNDGDVAAVDDDGAAGNRNELISNNDNRNDDDDDEMTMSVDEEPEPAPPPVVVDEGMALHDRSQEAIGGVASALLRSRTNPSVVVVASGGCVPQQHEPRRKRKSAEVAKEKIKGLVTRQPTTAASSSSSSSKITRSSKKVKVDRPTKASSSPRSPRSTRRSTKVNDNGGNNKTDITTTTTTTTTTTSSPSNSTKTEANAVVVTQSVTLPTTSNNNDSNSSTPGTTTTTAPAPPPPPPLSSITSLYHVLWSNILCYLDELSLYNIERAFPKKTRKVSLFQWKYLRQKDMGRIQHQRWRPPSVLFLRQQQQERFQLEQQQQQQPPSLPGSAAAAVGGVANSTTRGNSSSSASGGTTGSTRSGGRMMGRSQWDRTEWNGGTEEYLQSKSVMYGKDFARHILTLDGLVPDWDVYDEAEEAEDEVDVDVVDQGRVVHGDDHGDGGGIEHQDDEDTNQPLILPPPPLNRNGEHFVVGRNWVAASAHPRRKTRIPMGIGVTELGSCNYLLFLRLSLLPPKEQQPLPRQQRPPQEEQDHQTHTISTNAGAAARAIVPDQASSSSPSLGGPNSKKRKASWLETATSSSVTTVPVSADDDDRYNFGNDIATVMANLDVDPVRAVSDETDCNNDTTSDNKMNDENNKNSNNDDDDNDNSKKEVTAITTTTVAEAVAATTRHWYAFRQIFQIVVHPSSKMALSLSGTFGQFQGLAEDWPEVQEFLEWHALEWTIISTLLQRRKLSQEAESLYRYEESCQTKLVPLLRRMEIAITIPTAGHLVEQLRRRQMALEWSGAAAAAEAAAAAGRGGGGFGNPRAFAVQAAPVDGNLGPRWNNRPQIPPNLAASFAAAVGNNNAANVAPAAAVGTVNDGTATGGGTNTAAGTNIPTAQQLHESQLRLHESFVAVGRCCSLKWSRLYRTEYRSSIPPTAGGGSSQPLNVEFEPPAISSGPPQEIMPWEVVIPITNSLEATFLVYRQQPQQHHYEQQQ